MRRVILLGVAFVVAVALIGCGTTAEESTTEPSASPTAVDGEAGGEADRTPFVGPLLMLVPESPPA